MDTSEATATYVVSTVTVTSTGVPNTAQRSQQVQRVFPGFCTRLRSQNLGMTLESSPSVIEIEFLTSPAEIRSEFKLIF